MEGLGPIGIWAYISENAFMIIPYSQFITRALPWICIPLFAGCLNDAGTPRPAFKPVLSIDASALDFQGDTLTRLVTLKNSGNSYLKWGVGFFQDWCKVSPQGGMLDPGDWDTVRVTVFPHKLPMGIRNDVLTFRNNSADSLYPLPMTVRVETAPYLEYDPKAFRIRLNHDSAVFAFTNVGNAPGTWKVEVSDSALRPERTEFKVLPKDKAGLLVRVVRSRLRDTGYVFALRLISPASRYDLPVSVQNLRETRTPFGLGLVQSEACRDRNELHFIANYRFQGANPVAAPVYGIWNVGTGETNLLALPDSARRMDLASDCAAAAVALRHAMVVIDPAQLKVTRRVDLNPNHIPIDVAVTKSGAAYLNATYDVHLGGYYFLDLAKDSTATWGNQGTGKFTLTPDERFLVEAYAYFHDAWIHDVSAKQPIKSQSRRISGVPEEYFVLPKAQRIIDRGGKLYAFDAANLFKPIASGAGPIYLKFAVEAPRNALLLIAVDQAIEFRDASDLRLLHSFPMPYQAGSVDYSGDLPQVRQTAESMFLTKGEDSLIVLTRKEQGGPYDPKPAFHEAIDLRPYYALIDSLYPGRAP